MKVANDQGEFPNYIWKEFQLKHVFWLGVDEGQPKFLLPNNLKENEKEDAMGILSILNEKKITSFIDKDGLEVNELEF